MRFRLVPTAAVAATALATTTAVVLPISGAAAQTAPAGTEIQILGINDFHGHLDPSSSGPSVAGVLGGAVKALKAENPNTVFVSAGDSIGASPFISSSQRDEPTLDVLDAMGLAVSTVGNHEFDRGYADLAGRVNDRADFPYLGANVEGESPALAGSHVVTTPSGIRVGFIGVVTEQTATLVSPSGIPGITFTDPVAAANREAAALTDGNAANGEAEVIVLLAHEGPTISATASTSCADIGARDDAFGRIIRNSSAQIDAILGGHTHLTDDCEYPLAGGQVRPVLQASEYGKALARVRITYDPATQRVTAASGDVLPLTATSYTADPAVEQIVAAAKAQSDQIGREVIGSITEDVPRAKTSSGAEDRGTESLLGNFIADVQLDATKAFTSEQGGPAQIAFMNPGGLRADLDYDQISAGEQPGQVTYAEMAVVQPFANTLFTLTLTGAQIKAVLEEQYQPAGASRPFLALGVSKGFRYELQGTNPVGSRIQNITLNGVAVDPAGTYRVVTNSFLAGGGDNFKTLGTGANRKDTGLDDLSVVVSYLRASSPVTPDKTDRSVVLSLPPAPSPSASPTASATPTATISPLPAGCTTPVSLTLERSTIIATGSSGVTVRATPNGIVDLYAYTRPSTTFRVVRSAELGADGVADFRIAPPANTRLYAQQRGCPADPVAGSVVLNVRTALSLAVKRNAPRDYTFSGDSLPARAGGLIVSLYRVEPSGRQVLTAQVRAAAGTGQWSLTRRFTGTGRFGFVARTGQDAQNAPGASNVRSTLIY